MSFAAGLNSENSPHERGGVDETWERNIRADWLDTRYARVTIRNRSIRHGCFVVLTPLRQLETEGCHSGTNHKDTVCSERSFPPSAQFGAHSPCDCLLETRSSAVQQTACRDDDVNTFRARKVRRCCCMLLWRTWAPALLSSTLKARLSTARLPSLPVHPNPVRATIRLYRPAPPFQEYRARPTLKEKHCIHCGRWIFNSSMILLHH